MDEKKLKTMNDISAAEAVRLFHAAMCFDLPTDLYAPNPDGFPDDIAAKDFIEQLLTYREMWSEGEKSAASVFGGLYDEQRAQLANVAADVPEEDLPHLTRREKEVLALVREGFQDKEIAHKLAIGYGTVKFYVGQILRKFGVDDRKQLIAKLPSAKT